MRIGRLKEDARLTRLAEGLEFGCNFDEIWDKTIKKKDLELYRAEANPWVWVIAFERIEVEK